MFIFPVKKKEGFFNLVLQNQDKSFIYTFLDDFKKNPSTSTPYLVITLFDELVFTKNIVLIRGDIIGDLNVNEAHKILQMTKDFYLQDHLYKKVVEFNQNSRNFNFENHLNFCLNTYFTNNNRDDSDNKINVRNNDDFEYEDPLIKKKREDFHNKNKIDPNGKKPILSTFKIDKKH